MAESGIRITARRRFMQFLITTPLTVEVDGEVVGTVKWGAAKTAEFCIAAGDHRLTAYFPYLGRKRTGEASIGVRVPADAAVAVTYRSPFLVTQKGSLKLDAAV